MRSRLKEFRSGSNESCLFTAIRLVKYGDTSFTAIQGMMKWPVVLLITLYSSVFIRSAKLYVSSVDLVAEEGETVDLLCYFDLCINNSQIVFTRGGSVRTSSVLSSGLVRLRLVNVTSDHGGPYTCKSTFQTPSLCGPFVKTFRVSVFRRPLQPKIIRCVVRDWRWAECTWIPPTADQLSHTLMKNAAFIHQSLYVRHLQESLVWHPVNCTPMVNESCRWSLEGSDFDYFHQSSDRISGVRRKQTLCFRVDVLNLKIPSLSVSSDSHCINLDDYVLLDDVTDANIAPKSRSALLSWKQYRIAPGFTGSIIFKISYRSPWLGETEWSELFSNNSEIELVSLHPNSPYTVRIQAATVRSKIMSTAVDMNFRTEPSAPCKPPTLNENAFYVKSSNKTHRIVCVYWKDISEVFRCGDEFVYVVGVTSLDAPSTSYVTPLTSTSVAVSVWESRIDILARNRQGSSPPPDRWIRIPRLLHPNDRYTEFIEISSSSYVNRTLTVEWNLKRNLSENTEQIEFFWCDRLNDFAHLCLGDMNALSVPLNEKKIELNFSRCCDNYLIGFALASENSYSYGINWIECNCAGSVHSKETTLKGSSNPDSEERLICLTAREMSAMVVGYVIAVVLSTVILAGIVRKCWTDSYKNRLVVLPMGPLVKPLEDFDSAYNDEPAVSESNRALLKKMISVTPDESGGSTEPALLAIPLENSNSSETISGEPFCVYVLPKIDDQIPISKPSTASDRAPIPSTKIYVHYSPLSVASSNIGGVYRCYSGDYTGRCASNESSCCNLEDLAEPPPILRHHAGSVESDDTDGMEMSLLPRITQQTPVTLNCRTSAGRNDNSMDDETLACPISLSAKDSHPGTTSPVLIPFSSTLLPRVDLLHQVTHTATESRPVQDYNCARSFPECPPCTSSGSKDDDDGDGGGGGGGYTPQLQRAEEEVLENSCSSDRPLNVLPQLHQRDSRICDYGYTGGRARNGYFSDERVINRRPAAKLSSIDSWQS